MTDDEFTTHALRWRNVDDPCLTCSGSGRRLYASTATWRGGMGGAMMTVDVCDTCWGSGDRYRTGVDLRRLRDEESKRVAERALELLAHAAGATLQTCAGDVSMIVRVIEEFADKERRARKPRGTQWLPHMAQALANTLRRGLGLPEVKLP
jgi:hypothetical protein